MILKQVHFPIFILPFILLITVIFSCQKEAADTKNPKSNSKYSIYFAAAEKHFANQVYDSAFYYYNKSRLECKANENEKIIYSLLKMSVIQQMQSDFSGSETSATEAIPFFEKETNSYYKVAVYNILGINYENQFDYNNAIDHYIRAYNLTEGKLQKAVLQNNIAVVYMDKDNYKHAIKILLPLSTQKEVADNLENYSRILDNLGYSYFKTGNPEALNYLTKSLKIREQANDDFGLMASYIHLCTFYEKSDNKLAVHYARLTYEKATQINNVNNRLKGLSLLIKNSPPDEAKNFSILHLKINDSITIVKQRAKNQFAKIKYDSKKEKEENQKLRLEKAEHLLSLQEAKYQKIVFLIGIFFLIIIIVILRRYYINKNRIEKIQSSYDTEKRISKKIHDELANDVFHTITFAETQTLSKENEKENLLQKLDHIYTRVRGISRENNDIDTGENYSAIVKDLLSTYNNSTTNVIVNSIEKVNWETVDEIKKVTIYRVLQELMVNMKKHSEATLVVVKFDHTPKTILIDYVDNGKGCPKEKIIKNGLQNMENRIRAIKGTIIFDTEPNNGFKVKISTPK